MERASEVVVGKQPQIRLALACLLARGHLLIEDLPGVGKTTLAHLLARLLGLRFARIQFTSDLLPADILGTMVYERGSGGFRFHPGPVFSQVVLADEINRASPRTQSALLEAMEEQQVSVDTETHALPEPFFVIATQNPEYHVGTFPLPESQLDRFLMRLELGYPDPEAERALWRSRDRRELIDELEPVIGAAELAGLQRAAAGMHVSEALLDYLQALVSYSRQGGLFAHGLSPRAALALLQAARAHALCTGHDAVMPEDVQAVLGPVVDHRLRWADADSRGSSPGRHLLESVPLD